MHTGTCHALDHMTTLVADLLLSVVALQGLVCNAPSNDSSFALAYFGPLLERTLSNQLHEVHCGWSAWARLVWLLPRWHRVKAVSLLLCFTKSSCTVETWDMLWTATGWPFVYLLLLLGVGLANCKQADAGRRSRLGRIVDNALTAIQTCPEVHTVHLICLQIIIRFPLNKFVALAWLSAGCAGVPLSRSAIFSMLEGPYGWVAYVSGALFIKVGLCTDFERCAGDALGTPMSRPVCQDDVYILHARSSFKAWNRSLDRLHMQTHNRKIQASNFHSIWTFTGYAVSSFYLRNVVCLLHIRSSR